jgi:Zn-finger protein
MFYTLNARTFVTYFVIVEKTNEYMRKPQDNSCSRARENEWYPTNRGEICLLCFTHIYDLICRQRDLRLLGHKGQIYTRFARK